MKLTTCFHSSVVVKNGWSYTSTRPPYALMVCTGTDVLYHRGHWKKCIGHKMRVSCSALINVSWIMCEVSSACTPLLHTGCHYWCCWSSGMLRLVAADLTDNPTFRRYVVLSFSPMWSAQNWLLPYCQTWIPWYTCVCLVHVRMLVRSIIRRDSIACDCCIMIGTGGGVLWVR